MPGGGPTSCEKQVFFLPITAGDGLTSCEKHLVLVSTNMAGYMSSHKKKHPDLVGNNMAGDGPSFHGNHPVLVELQSAICQPCSMKMD